MQFPKIHNPDDLISLVEQFGFLPFFKHSIEGFSIEECCPPKLWFSPDQDGPWEWKGPVIKSGTCVYGKFFNAKAGFISREWLPDFANYRRDGYDFDARFDDELASYKDKELFDAIAEREIILSTDLKKALNYRKGGNKGFDTIITRLQMQTYVCVADFIYRQDKSGKQYGWGVAQYTTPEVLFGDEFVTSAYRDEPSASKRRIVDHLKRVLPEATEQEILRLIK